jgi:PilZ domain
MAEEEKRIAPRQRVLKAAKIITMDNTSVIDCTVRNLSDTGAQLIIEKSVRMPDEFQFFLANGDTVRDAVLAWHRGDRVGLKFKGESRPAPHALRMYKR